MIKRFIPLNSDSGAGVNPFQIRTWEQPKHRNDSANLETIETTPKKSGKQSSGDIQKLIEKQFFNTIKSKSNKTVKKICKVHAPYTQCVRIKRTPQQIRDHAIAREKVIEIQEQLFRKSCLVEFEKKKLKKYDIIKFPSPTNIGNVKKASPSPSLVYVPSRKLLDLKKPKSGIYINETPVVDGSVPFENYNPRLLQDTFDRHYNPFEIVEVDGEQYVRRPNEVNNNGVIQDCCCYRELPSLVNNLSEEAITEKELFLNLNINVDSHEQNRLNESKLDQNADNINVDHQFSDDDKKENFFNDRVILQIYAEHKINRTPIEKLSRQQLEIAVLFTAYAFNYVSPVHSWNMSVVDQILRIGSNQHTHCVNDNYISSDSDYDIDPCINIWGTPMTIMLSRPIIVGKHVGVPNLSTALKDFFRDRQACIFVSENVFILIWKYCDFYQIFDPNGRNKNNFFRDDQYGSACLLKCSDLNTVDQLIQFGSGCSKIITFKLYDIRLQSYGHPQGTPLTNYFEKPNSWKHYVVVNKYYALVRSSDGIAVPKKQTRNASMLSSCLARIYADIDPARFWTKKVIDQLRRYSNKIFEKQCKAQQLKNYDINNLPLIHRLGSFRTEIKIIPFYTSGQIYKNCDSFRNSQFAIALCSLLESFDSGLVQIDCSTIAVWRDSKFYYAFDPFRRGPAGMYIDREEKGAACLQMHLTLRSLCETIYEIAKRASLDANFFIHSMEIIKIRVAHHSKLKTEQTDYPLLLLDCPARCDEEIRQVESDKDLNKNFIADSLVPSNCLSVLSVSPCERTCSEKDLLEAERKQKALLKKEMNIKSRISEESTTPLPRSQKIDWFDNYDIVRPILDGLLCKIVEFGSNEPKPRKVAKARKVLLKSDQNYLHGLINKIQRGEDYDNYFNEFSTTPNTEGYVMSLEKELKIDTPFELLPDGSWIVIAQETLNIENTNLNIGPLSAFVAITLSGKFNIKFWNGKLIDYVMKTSQNLQHVTHIPKNIATFFLRSHMPNIQIGDEIFNVTIQQVTNGPARNLHKMLQKGFKTKTSLMLLCNTYSCALFKRNVFFYMFTGLPCDSVGFRCDNSELPCLIRFLDLPSAVRRIHTNRTSNADNQNVMLFSISTKKVNVDDVSFLPRSASDEEIFYNNEKDQLKKKQERQQMKILFLKDELEKEMQRIQEFRKEKWPDADEYYEVSEEEEEMFEDEEEESLRQHATFKHWPQADLPSTDSVRQESGPSTRRPPLLGYMYYQPDHNFKIQGTTALENRKSGSINTIRACHFASIYAIMYAIHRPLKKWDFRRVDMAIENAIQLDNMTKDKNVCNSRIINKITIDNYVCNVEIKVFEINESRRGVPIEVAIRKICETKLFFMIQFENATFAVHKDDHFHLFDAYNTLDTVSNTTDLNKPIAIPKVKPAVDRNTASWIIFPNIDYMLAYIEERMVSPNWKTDFKLYTINILSTKRGPKRDRLANTLMNSPIGTEYQETNYLMAELQTEKVRWIEMHSEGIPWSPLRLRNLNNDKRGEPHAKWKDFDIEIAGKLYSLWGNIHPNAAIFGVNRGKQYLAINVMSCLMAHIYRVEEWTKNIIDSIVVHGDMYYTQSIKTITKSDYEISLEDLDTEFKMGKLHNFVVHLESVVFGLLYDTNPKVFNLSKALSFFFMNSKYGIIQCMNKSICFGKSRTGYFLFDCQSHSQPLFMDNQGCAYVLLASTLDMLLYCIVVLLRIPYYNVEFVLYTVRPRLMNPEITSVTKPIETNEPEGTIGNEASNELPTVVPPISEEQDEEE